MRLILEKRADRSAFFAIASPFLALLLTLIAGGLIFALRGVIGCVSLADLDAQRIEPLPLRRGKTQALKLQRHRQKPRLAFFKRGERLVRVPANGLRREPRCVRGVRALVCYGQRAWGR